MARDIKENLDISNVMVVSPDVGGVERARALGARTGFLLCTYPSEELVAKHDVVIAHDLAYADVVYDGYHPTSILEVPGAKDVAIEFNSLSKAFNMTGWRVGFAVGNTNLKPEIADIKDSAIKRVTVTHANGEKIIVAKGANGFIVENMPKGLEMVTPSTAEDYAKLLDTLKLDDVAEGDAIAPIIKGDCLLCCDSKRAMWRWRPWQRMSTSRPSFFWTRMSMSTMPRTYCGRCPRVCAGRMRWCPSPASTATSWIRPRMPMA